MRKKAILAVAFASGLVSSLVPTVAKETAIPDSIVQRLAANNNGIAETRAYDLLQVAASYVQGSNSEQIEKLYGPVLEQKNGLWHYKNIERWLKAMAEQQSIKVQRGEFSKIGEKEAAQANLAIKEAQKQLDHTNNQVLKPIMTYIASCLYKRLGNTAGEKECEKLLSIQAATDKSSITAEQAGAAIEILNARAFGYLPLELSDQFIFGQRTQAKLSDYKDSDFKASEKLRLEALAIADKLPEDEHVRRKAHRDMVIWYRSLGKEDLAKEQLQTLYKLVKYEDETVLYPQHGGCGTLVWWQKEKHISSFDCGMG